jgi:hypothetical protein
MGTFFTRFHLMEASMAGKTLAELQADWLATSKNITFREKLDSGTDEFKYKILAALLDDELKDLEAEPPP